MRGFIDGEYQDGEIRGLVFCIGDRGFGKTTLVQELLSQCTGGRIFFDTESKHQHLFPDYVVIGDCARLIEYLRPNRGRQFKVLYQPRTGNLETHFRNVCSIVKAFGWMILAVDELNRFCGSKWGELRMPPELCELVDYGRHHRVSMIATARKPVTVAAGYRDQAELRVFRITRGSALEWLDSELGRETTQQIRRLDKFYYFHCPVEGDPVLRGGPRAL